MTQAPAESHEKPAESSTEQPTEEEKPAMPIDDSIVYPTDEAKPIETMIDDEDKTPQLDDRFEGDSMPSKPTEPKPTEAAAESDLAHPEPTKPEEIPTDIPAEEEAKPELPIEPVVAEADPTYDTPETSPTEAHKDEESTPQGTLSPAADKIDEEAEKPSSEHEPEKPLEEEKESAMSTQAMDEKEPEPTKPSEAATPYGETEPETAKPSPGYEGPSSTQYGADEKPTVQTLPTSSYGEQHTTGSQYDGAYPSSNYPAPTYGDDDYADEEDPTSFGPGTCRYGGKLYVSAQQIPRDDPCDFCFCFRSDIICLQQSCPPPINGCHEEPISGFCCPRYECPVSMATVLNITTSTTTTTTTLPPLFNQNAYKGKATRQGCMIDGKSYQVGEVVQKSSGPCMNCT